MNSHLAVLQLNVFKLYNQIYQLFNKFKVKTYLLKKIGGSIA